MNYKRSLLWVRRDLRTHDHHAWHEISNSSDSYAVVFVFDINIIKKLPLKLKDPRLFMIANALKEMDQVLRKNKSKLIILFGDPLVEIPKLAKKLKVSAVFYNKDYEPEAIRRDSNVQASLENENIAFHGTKDQVIFEENEIRTKSDTPFKVYTAYKNAWRKNFRKEDVKSYKINLKNLINAKNLKNIGLDLNKFLGKAPAVLSEQAAKSRWKNFLKNVDRYDQTRDIPSIDGTSQMSIHLRFGTISVRQMWRDLLKKSSKGALVYGNELIWREFYQMILFQFPYVEKHFFKRQYESLKFENNKKLFLLWKAGQTGYPIVDAAMRKFRDTGVMHNRLRMIVASFLVKDLLIDYRWGEKYFADKLLDFDLAANNGGWQWSASTGCDAQPYFRIFSPVEQSKRFDPEGKFIKKYCKELKAVPESMIHSPWLMKADLQEAVGCVIGKDYPKPVVDHKTRRLRALRMFKRVKN